MTDRHNNGTDTSLGILLFEHISRDRVCPASVIFDFLTVLKMVDRTDEKAGHTETRIILVTIRYAQIDFWGIFIVIFCFAIVIASKLPVISFFMTDDNTNNDRCTKTDC